MDGSARLPDVLAPNPSRPTSARPFPPAFDLVPLALLAVGAGFHAMRIPVLVLLLAGFGLQWRDRGRRGAPWAGAIPVAVALAWTTLAPLPPSATDGSTCTSPLAPFATARVVEAVVALTVLVMLARLVGSGGGELGLRRPARSVGLVAIAAFAVAGPLGMLVGPALAAPFFGPIGLATGDPRSLVPALAFAIANGVMEELLYRGALQAWTARRTGLPIAVAGQAVVFGLAHAAGADVGGDPLLLGAAMTGAGLVAGWIAWRTGSLFVPIAAHVGFDLPLFYGNACRV